MGSAWRDFQMPSRIECDESTYTNTYGKFTAEPFERGYGSTIGNSLRRILLSSLEGAAITSVRFEGVSHGFSAIPGVAEDVAEIIMNLKQVILKAHTRSPKTLTLSVEKKGEVTAGQIVTDESVEILNPDLKIATLTKAANFKVEMEVGIGRGYVPVERNRKESQPIGVIALDSAFSPVKRVNFRVEDTRVGQMTDYDKLIMEVTTNGAINPKEALLTSAYILQKHLDVFTGFGELPADEAEGGEEVLPAGVVEKLRMPVTELELSVRSANCLREAKIKTIADLVQKSEGEILKFRNFGKKSLAEIAEILKGMGLTLGMKLDKGTLSQVEAGVL
ncbi:MAG: DNA-directed RNA polymerase subunit alpha [Candidatus Omnitrophica bacterium CG11_big_fil_rev_8_21_14_0_20_64_10]|nr:MAG: DNA-directed RNA polymerase subunit alpha [Candidatus Omnitrophica bacterium CG11_big_fil_rev_8_21_14_0_20_64_10]